MKRLICTLAVAISTFPASFAKAAGSAPATVITNPDWESKPTGDDMGRYYPGLGRSLNLEGLTTLKCIVLSSGSLDSCQAINEQPIGIGFGAAAVAMSGVFKMKPKKVNGIPVSGGEITIPIHFTLAEEDTGSLSDIPEPSAASRALATRLVIGSMDAKLAMAEFIKSQVAYMRQETFTPTTALDVEVHKIAMQSIDDAVDTEIAVYSNQIVKFIAQHLTADELQAVVAFGDTPAGKALNARRPSADDLAAAAAFSQTPAGKAFAAMMQELERGNPAVWKPVYQATVDDARRRFCAKIACVATSSGANKGAR